MPEICLLTKYHIGVLDIGSTLMEWIAHTATRNRSRMSTDDDEQPESHVPINGDDTIDAPPARSGHRSADPPRPPTLRALALDALAELGWPAYSRELAPFITARAGRAVTVSSLNALAEAERRAYQRGTRQRAVWLCCGLTYDRYESIARLWARSDWPLHRRIVAPTTGRVQYLTITARLCDPALHAEAAADPALLRVLAAEHARDLPGIRVEQGAYELTRWRDVALALLAEYWSSVTGHCIDN
jgi:hypothetical protein